MERRIITITAEINPGEKEDRDSWGWVSDEVHKIVYGNSTGDNIKLKSEQTVEQL